MAGAVEKETNFYLYKIIDKGRISVYWQVN